MAPVGGYAGLEVGMVGNEGMFGIGLLLGVDVSPLHALVQGAGPALRMNAKQFRLELEDSPALNRELNRYLYVLMSQLAQTAACTASCCRGTPGRWLLMTGDRARSDEFYLTRSRWRRRVGVTGAARSLQRSAS